MVNPKSNIDFNSFLSKFGTTTNAKSKTATKQKHFSLENYTFGYLPNVASRESDQSIIQYIDTTTIIAFEFDNIQTYTFNVVPTVETENTFYNIIFYQNSEGTQSKLLKYESDFDYLNSIDIPFSGTIYEIEEDETVVNIYSSGNSSTNSASRLITDCAFSTSTVSVNCSGDNHVFGDPTCLCGTSGHSCTPAFEYTVTDLVCITYNTGGGSNPDDGDDSTGGTGSTADDNSNQNDDGTFNLPTEPVKGENTNWISFFTDLDSDYQAFLNSNTTFRDQIQYFLWQNYYSNESAAFATLAVEALAVGGDVDFANEVILDETFVNNEKLKCVYEKLTADNNPLFRDTVGAFINDPDFNLTFRVGTCPTTDDQCTNSADPYNIVITFEDVGISAVEMAQAILHEAIHAEMARYIAQYESGVDVNDRPRIFQLYQYYKDYYENKDINHLYMIEKYLDPITSALRQFDNNSYPLDYYKSFAWDGLRYMDPDDILSLPINSTYASYRTIVIQNSDVCN